MRFFCDYVRNGFNVGQLFQCGTETPKTTLPVWHRDIKRLDTLGRVFALTQEIIRPKLSAALVTSNES